MPTRQRIAKAMARAGLCSRRDAEAWVLAGRVSVNGEVLASPARDVGPDDTILVDGQPLPSAEKTRLFLFHKPRGLVTSDHDPEGRETVVDFLRENWPEGPRVVTVGRLDINTEGLLLLTNDGGLARMLELPETGWLRRYRVRANGQTDQAALDGLAAGIEIDGIAYAGIEAKLDRLQGSNCWLTIGLREGKNREVKRVLEHLGLEVNRLIRLSFGPFQLLDLPEGAVEEVRTRVLRDQLGEKLAVAAGVDLGGDEAAAQRVPESGHDPAERGRGKRPGPPTTKTLSLSGKMNAGLTGRQEQRDEAEPAQRRERSQEGPRRHVSALRATQTTSQRTGSRKRIERTATRDRHDRPIAVERLITRDAPSRSVVRSPGRKKASLSAEAKRVRVARSGGETAARGGGEEPRRGRPRAYGEGPGRDAAPAPREPRRSSGRAAAGEGERVARPRRDDADRVRRDRPQEGGSRFASRKDSRDGVARGSSGATVRPARRSGPRDARAEGERRSERPSRHTTTPPRGRPEGGLGAGAEAGKRHSGKPSYGKPSYGKPPSGRPTSDKPPARRPPSDRSSKSFSGKPRPGKPFSGKPSGRPGGSKPKR